MKRVQLFEFEDFKWFPNWLRDAMTNLIVVLQKMIGTNEVVANLIQDSIQGKDINQIVDLGSGSGGTMPDVIKLLKEKEGNEGLSLLMTDLYPNKVAINQFNSDTDESISYNPESVDATNLESSPSGLKTMMNCFHHMRPEQAQKILSSAQDNSQPLLIYELTENKMPLIIWWIMLPISLVILIVMTLFMTPFVKPLTWKQVVFTYLIPIIPFFYAWDGQASMPRMYAMNDIDEMINKLDSSSYTWKQGYALNKKGKKTGTYILGMPKL